MKRWINSLFFSRSTTKKIAHWNHMCNTKIEYKKIVMHKKQSYFFASHNNDILILFYFIFLWYRQQNESHNNDILILFYFIFLWYVIFLFLQDNKNISPWYNILNDVQNKKMVSNEKHFFVKKKNWCCRKSSLVSSKASQYCTKRISRQQKKVDITQKKYFMSTKII